MSLKIKNHLFITGAGEGIGLELLKYALLNNKNLIITCHYFIKTLEFEQVCKSYSSRINLIKSDFSKENSINKFLIKLKKYRITHVANIAGIHDFSKNKKNRLKNVYKTFAVNSIVPSMIIETLFPYMQKNKYGNIVNISSIGVKYGSNIDSIFYGSSKAALEAITTSFSRIGASSNILVNTIRPGITKTDFYTKINKNLNERIKLIPIKRAAQPLEIAKFIYLILFENTFMTGQTLSIAGGE